MKIQNKTALITGAARGIGQAIAVQLANHGVDIIAIDLKMEDLKETEQLVQRSHRKFFGFACDISEEASILTMLAKVEDQTPGFDILINNAGILPSGPFLECEFSVWRKTIEVNLIGLMMLTYRALPALLNRSEGHIVNIASIAGKFGTEGVAAYAASKHGVVGFSSALREELRDTSVGVSWICPSLVATRLSENVSYTFLTPKVSPEAVARAVCKTIETNAAEVFVPKRVRLVVSIFPALSQRLARWILKWSRASEGWVTAKKSLVN
ncbi:MAG: SDR family NAD(P)-dependent oxidoreductase [Calditrichaeota bacterium]|nr:MAG: SDR family NAD(P)-dependent oxidoreductase [Calditrichota bacterium]